MGSDRTTTPERYVNYGVKFEIGLRLHQIPDEFHGGSGVTRVGLTDTFDMWPIAELLVLVVLLVPPLIVSRRIAMRGQRPPRTRPAWMVGVLTFLTFGSYGLVWLALTWREIGDALGDRRLRPMRHLLAALIPFYGARTIDVHVSKINELRMAHGLPAVRRTGIAATVLISWLLILPTNVVIVVPLVFDLGLPDISGVLAPYLVGWALVASVAAFLQSQLNECWSIDLSPSPSRLGRLEWVAMMGLTLFWGDLVFATARLMVRQ